MHIHKINNYNLMNYIYTLISLTMNKFSEHLNSTAKIVNQKIHILMYTVDMITSEILILNTYIYTLNNQ